MIQSRQQPHALNRVGRRFTLFSYFGLVAVLLNWFTWLEPPQRLPIALTVLLWVGPLLLPLPGLLAGRLRAQVWLSLLALCYFAFGVFCLAGPMLRPWLAELTTGLSVGLFIGSVVEAQTRASPRRADPPKAATGPK